MNKAKAARCTLIALGICLFMAGTALAQGKLSNGVAWVSRAAEYKCCVQQAYLGAQRRLHDLVKGEKEGGWCVVLDADETIISNVEFQAELDVKNISYSGVAWDDWCRKERATALPGAKELMALVKKLGGRVIIITNREGDVRQATIKNLDSLGLPYDACLLREGPYATDRNKTARRADVEKGSVKTLPEGKSLPPLKIIMRVGDQAHDLYDSGKLGFDDVKDRFGRDFVIIPNPMYGSFLSAATAK